MRKKILGLLVFAVGIPGYFDDAGTWWSWLTELLGRINAPWPSEPKYALPFLVTGAIILVFDTRVIMALLYAGVSKGLGAVGVRLYRRHWLQMNRIMVWHAACLWANQEPHRPIIVSSAPYPYLKDMEAAIRERELIAKRVHPDLTEEFWFEIEKDNLIKWINDRGFSPRPKFLFPNG